MATNRSKRSESTKCDPRGLASYVIWACFTYIVKKCPTSTFLAPTRLLGTFLFSIYIKNWPSPALSKLNCQTIVWFSSKVTTLNSNFLMVYSSENMLFLYLHFTWLYCSSNHERILKKHPFWKFDDWFSSELSKPTLVKYPWNHTFLGMTKIDFHQYSPKIFISLTKYSQYCL